MSKKLKLNSFATARTLRSEKTLTIVESSRETSPYFVGKQLTSTQTGAKKRVPIKIEYEIAEDKVSVGNTVPMIAVCVKSEIAKEPANTDTIKTEKLKIRSEDTGQSKNVTDIKFETVEIIEHWTDSEYERQSQWMPLNWEIIFKNIREMKHNTTPVDEMGFDKCADPNASPAVSRYQTLIALMLSSQTNDHITYAAMRRLNAYGCKPDIIVQTPDNVLGRLIHPVCFWKRKVDYIKRTSAILLNKYNGDIPKTIKELCDLPGVGPKMAHMCMQIAWGKVCGIVVSPHVHRISNRLGWVKQQTLSYEKTKRELEDWLPKSLWGEINHLFVTFGQQICLPRCPKCDECLNKDICPYAKKIGMV